MEKKDLNEILTRMVSGNDEKPIIKVSSTDFTPKKKPSFKIRFKKKINSIKKSKFLMGIKKWFNNTMVKPYQTRKAKRLHNRYVKELKYNFSKKFNVDVNRTIEIMRNPKHSVMYMDNYELLIKNSLDINRRKSLHKFTPTTYNPEIIDIHNENLNLENPTISEIISDENMEAVNTLNKQGEFFSKRQNLTKKKLRIRI
jgi:hypothetical protein